MTDDTLGFHISMRTHEINGRHFWVDGSGWSSDENEIGDYAPWFARPIMYSHDISDTGADAIDDFPHIYLPDNNTFISYHFSEEALDDITYTNDLLDFKPGILEAIAFIDLDDSDVDAWIKNFDNNPFECWIDPGTNLDYSYADRSQFFREAGIHLERTSPLIEYISLVDYDEDLLARAGIYDGCEFNYMTCEEDLWGNSWDNDEINLGVCRSPEGDKWRVIAKYGLSDFAV